MSDSQSTKKYWEQQTPDVTGMMLNDQAAELEEMERIEICSYIPDVTGFEVLELAAGIGRFTGYLATRAKHVTAVDFVEAFLEKNKSRHAAKHQNIHYICDNVKNLEFEPESKDFIFINWLMMYLEDDEVAQLFDNIHLWLKKDRLFFFRESCISPSNPNSYHPYSHYRDPKFYTSLLDNRFEIVRHGNVKIYEKMYDNPNQLWWLLRKK